MTGSASSAGPVTVDVTATPGPASLRDWDRLVRAHPCSDVAQLSAWARVRAQAGMTAVYVLADRGGHLVGGAQILIRRVPAVGTVGYVPYGPVGGRSLHDALAGALDEYARGHLRMLVVQPPLDGEASTEALLRRGFRSSDSSIAPGGSIRIDLSRDEGELRHNLSKRLRRWTHRWEARGVVVRRGTEQDLPTVARLLERTAAHQGFAPFDADYLTGMYRQLAPTGDLVLFVGEALGRPVATALLTACGGVLKARLVGLDRSSDAAGLNVPAAVYWTAITWGKENGYQWFDFGGIRPSSAAALLSGCPGDDGDRLDARDQYKLRFGGEAYRYPTAVELIPSSVLRAGYDLALRSAGGRYLVDRAKRLARTGAFAAVTRPSTTSVYT